MISLQTSGSEELFVKEDPEQEEEMEAQIEESHEDGAGQEHEVEEQRAENLVANANIDDATIESSKSHKRKKSSAPPSPNKAQKKSDVKESKATPVQLVKFLLSDAATKLCRPDDEIKDLQGRDEDTTTYSNLLSPFQELLCAVILSRPVSHTLGLRSIRTILNPPYSLTTPKAIQEAGAEKVRHALEDAHTQHKDKTTKEITLIADAVLNNDWGNDLERLREDCKSVDEERETLRKSIKGLGKTGLDIFYRRVQWQWEETFPFVDPRTKRALEKMGLPGEADELVKLLDECWEEQESDEEDGERKRRALVVVMERAIGADLGKKVDEFLAVGASE